MTDLVREPGRAEAEAAREEEARAAWMHLGECVLTATERDRDQGARPVGNLEMFAQIFGGLLKPWFAGAAAPDYARLDNTVRRLFYQVSPLELAEQEAARRWLTLEARIALSEAARARGPREASFVLVPDGDGRYTAPRLSVCGNRTRTVALGADVNTSDSPLALILHTHPSGDLEPSDPDLNTMCDYLGLRPTLGFGIISSDAERLYLLREPRTVASFATKAPEP